MIKKKGTNVFAPLCAFRINVYAPRWHARLRVTAEGVIALSELQSQFVVGPRRGNDDVARQQLWWDHLIL